MIRISITGDVDVPVKFVEVLPRIGEHIYIGGVREVTDVVWNDSLAYSDEVVGSIPVLLPQVVVGPIV